MWLHIITIILLIAKLTGYFVYSWWWVWAPSIIAIGFGLLFLGGLLMAYLLTRDV